jgi:GNAT superfamily N-acetyltransferase
MLVPFQKETLAQERFVRDEVRFNLFNTISGGALAVALQAEDGGAVALANPGRNMWLWIDPALRDAYAASVIDELAERLKEAKLPGVVAAPGNAELFSKEYCRKSGAVGKLDFDLAAYACPKVSAPAGVPGGMEKAGEEHAEIAADFLIGFNRDCFQVETSPEDARTAAAGLIGADKLFLWNAGGMPVCMAAVANRSPRHARIGYVYTPPQERKKGYASALVAQVSRMVSEEGLVPMLYADVKNPDSNKVYRVIGYLDAGVIREIGFHH